MKFWSVHHEEDPAGSDVLFPTKAERERYILETYGRDDPRVTRGEIEVNGRLTKAAVCRVYAQAQR